MTRRYPYGYRTEAPGWPASMLTADELMTRPAWARLHPEVRRRHIALFNAAQDAGTILGIGGGWRSAAQQEATFTSRYSPDVPAAQKAIAKSKVTWRGQVWYIKSNSLAPSAPPGLSWHEECPEVIDNDQAWAYAVDTVGDWAWLAENCARFGLVEFSTVNNEPWHTQPVELPVARRNYAGQVLRQFSLPVLPIVLDPDPLPLPPTSEEDDMSYLFKLASGDYGIRGPGGSRRVSGEEFDVLRLWRREDARAVPAGSTLEWWIKRELAAYDRSVGAG